MIRRWLALTYYLYALQLAALSHFYFNPLYFQENTVNNATGFYNKGYLKTSAEHFSGSLSG